MIIQSLFRFAWTQSVAHRIYKIRQDLHVNPEKSCKSCLVLTVSNNDPGLLRQRLLPATGSEVWSCSGDFDESGFVGLCVEIDAVADPAED